jgi:hypothetical protein
MCINGLEIFEICNCKEYSGGDEKVKNWLS